MWTSYTSGEFVSGRQVQEIHRVKVGVRTVLSNLYELLYLSQCFHLSPNVSKSHPIFLPARCQHLHLIHLLTPPMSSSSPNLLQLTCPNCPMLPIPQMPSLKQIRYCQQLKNLFVSFDVICKISCF